MTTYVQKFKEDLRHIQSAKMRDDTEEGMWLVLSNMKQPRNLREVINEIKKRKKESSKRKKDDMRMTRLYHNSQYAPLSKNTTHFMTDGTTWHHSFPGWQWNIKRRKSRYITRIPTNELEGLGVTVLETFNGPDPLVYHTFVLPPFYAKSTKNTNRTNQSNRTEVNWLRWQKWNPNQNLTKGYPFPNRLTSKSTP